MRTCYFFVDKPFYFCHIVRMAANMQLSKNVKMEKGEIMKYKNFGDFLSSKRKEHNLTLRKMADLLGISAAFLTDVEKDRRNPFDQDKLERISEIFHLSEDECSQMMDLVGKKRDSVPPDVQSYVKPRAYVSAALRTARDLDASEEDWQKFVDELKRRKG